MSTSRAVNWNARTCARFSPWNLLAWIPWLATALPLVLGVVSVLTLQSFANDRREIEHVLVQVQAQANGLSQIQARSLATGRVSKRLGDQAQASEGELSQLTDVLALRDGDRDSLADVVLATRSY